MKFQEYVRENVIITDGAMGTYYGEKYHRPGKNPETANLSHPERILEIHREYLAAGALFLRTNSFSSNLRTLFGPGELEETDRGRLLELLSQNVECSYRIAKQAVEESGKHAFIAGDIGPIPEQGIKAGQEGIKAAGEELSEEEALSEEYRAIVDGHLAAGASILLFETFSDFKYILPAAAYAKEKADICILASFCLNKFGHTRSGLSASGILKTAAGEPAVDGVGFNCGIGSTHMYQILKKLDFGNLLVSAVPNSGYPDIINDRNGYQENTAYFCENMQKIAGLGLNLVGGCCGTTPAYIQRISDVISGPAARRREKEEIISSGGRPQKEANSFYRKLMSGKKAVIVELDPPHDGRDERILQASLLLKESGVDMLTFSDSPMGKMRADSMMTGGRIQKEIEVPVMPHVTCRDKNRLGMGSALLGAHMSGIRNLLIVTGDPVPQGDLSGITPVFDFNSMKLMEYIGQMNEEFFPEDPIVYGGALNYGRANLSKELERMEKKRRAGADYFLTQPIYGPEDVERIACIKEKTDAKIMCGIMPLVSYRNAMFMKNEVFGVHVPEETVLCYRPDMTREEGEETGILLALEVAGQLRDIADGYYFMAPFNRASMICKILERMREQCLI